MRKEHAMTLRQMIERRQRDLAALAETRASQDAVLVELRTRAESGSANLDEVNAAIAARAATDQRIRDLDTQIKSLETEERESQEILNALNRSTPTGASPETQRVGYDQVIRVGNTTEERTYAPHKERGFDQRTGQLRPGSRPGADFERDVASAFLFQDYEAQQRLARHRQEERLERAAYLNAPGVQQRAVGTGAFAGLTVPQYLTDMWAPAAAAMRPFADIARPHDLPASGMTLEISRITTATSAANQATENSALSETNIDDTLLPVSILTAGGQQTMSRQSIERGTNTEPVVLDDLYRRYATNLDSVMLNVATNGLTNVATATATYVDASPTVAEFIPVVSYAASLAEAALLDNSSGELVAVMHSRRWYWINQALTTSHPLLNQPGAITNALGVNYATTYGRGFRGILPNNIPVIVDNNVATNLGGGAEDEVYIVDRNEIHLWEDPAAPMFIRAEQPAAASLGVLLVVYGYFAFTHVRLPHAQKISGTGLTTPTWTGV
jgi:hypothetical protein